MNFKGELVKFDYLPSRGKKYPDDIEIYVKPMTLKEELSISTDRHDITRARYYKNLLDSIYIEGNFDKNKLFYSDCFMIDLIRRLYSFELEEAISIEGYKCDNCNEDLKVSFKFHELIFSDFNDDIYGKEFDFSNGLVVKISPMTIDKFIFIAKKYLTNAKKVNGVPDITDFTLGYTAACVTEVVDRVFENDIAKLNFLVDFFGSLYKNIDRNKLKIINDLCSTAISPFKINCQHCSSEVEVGLMPTMQFRQ
jgi:hypothetical protein